MSITLPAAGQSIGTWESDPIHSTAAFSVRHVTLSTFRARFESVDAYLAVGADGRMALTGAVRADSMELRFASSAIRRDGDRIELGGTLTIDGRTVPFTAKGTMADGYTDSWGTERLGLRLLTIVDRQKFDPRWDMPGGVALSGDVTLDIDLGLTRA